MGRYYVWNHGKWQETAATREHTESNQGKFFSVARVNGVPLWSIVHDDM